MERGSQFDVAQLQGAAQMRDGTQQQDAARPRDVAHQQDVVQPRGLEQLRAWAKFKRRDLKTRVFSAVYRRTLAGIEKHCLFLGYPRSGHTLVASLLDAHPNIVISSGVDPLQYLERGFRHSQLFTLYCRQSERFARTERKSGGYSYVVPNQWHGRYEALKVVGDKSGDLISDRLLRDPAQLDALLAYPRVQHQFLHVIRNPYDNIATCAARNRISLEEATDYYFALCDTAQAARRRIGEANWLDVWHEAMIEDPRHGLKRVLGFLGQPPDETYLRDCASIVYKHPHKSRYDAPWTPQLIGTVAKRARAYPYLAGYGFDS